MTDKISRRSVLIGAASLIVAPAAVPKSHTFAVEPRLFIGKWTEVRIVEAAGEPWVIPVKELA